MKFVADFHLHSRYSRATSKVMDLENLRRWALRKGIKVLGTADFTHPAWFKELRSKLELVKDGLYQLKKKYCQNDPAFNNYSENLEPFFICVTELSNIFSREGKTYRTHNLIFAPSFEIVEKINARLAWQGNLKADGRPILGMDVKDLLKTLFDISGEIMVIPAHAWTPWFSVFGSASGFDSLEDCFGPWAKKIFAIETGLSSDPEMNWRLSSLDKISLISNSDAHSPDNLGREGNVFNCEISYSGIKKALLEGEEGQFPLTLEFFPHEGKYHYDGHRNCNVCFAPEESEKYNNICPKCGKPLTLGVLHRVKKLADRQEGKRPPHHPQFKCIIPLLQIISEALERTPASKVVMREYLKIINATGNEFAALLQTPFEEIQKITFPIVCEAIKRMREGRVYIKPGYDGVYGTVKIFDPEERKRFATFQSQARLF